MRRRDHNEFLRQFRTWFPVGHFYSPYPDLDEVERRADAIFDPDVEIAGVDLREGEQVALLGSLSGFMADLPFPAQPDKTHRYHLDNSSYGWTDGIILHAMLRHLRPQRVIEVGPGYSSAMLLDTADGWLDDGERSTQIRFIEPYPQLLHDLMRSGDEERAVIDARPVQDVPLDVFDTLEAGDLLFIDSTHVAKGRVRRQPPVLRGAPPPRVRCLDPPARHLHAVRVPPRVGPRGSRLAGGVPVARPPDVQRHLPGALVPGLHVVTPSRPGGRGHPGVANNLGGNIWLQKA